jgi:hypothetical protein
VLSLILLTIFGLWERHLERNTTFPPIVKLSLFRRHGYRIVVVVISVFFISIFDYGYLYLVSIWYQTYMEKTALQSAIRMLPVFISSTFISVDLSQRSHLVKLRSKGAVMWLGPRVHAAHLIVVGCLLSG